MAAPQNGADLVLMVEDPATPGAYLPISDMDNFDDGSDQTEGQFPVFGNIVYVTPGPRLITLSMSGFRNGTDAGQTALRNAEKNRTEIRVKVLYDGTNGYTVLTRVKSRKGNAKPEGLQTIAFDFLASAPSVAVAGGPAI
jgi:hypothetical protein